MIVNKGAVFVNDLTGECLTEQMIFSSFTAVVWGAYSEAGHWLGVGSAASHMKLRPRARVLCLRRPAAIVGWVF